MLLKQPEYSSENIIVMSVQIENRYFRQGPSFSFLAVTVAGFFLKFSFDNFAILN